MVHWVLRIHLEVQALQESPGHKRNGDLREASRDYLHDHAGNIMNLYGRVKRDQTSTSMPRQFDHPGIVHLLMSQGPLIEPRFGGGRRLPKLRAGMLAVLLQQSRGGTGTATGSIGGAEDKRMNATASGTGGPPISATRNWRRRPRCWWFGQAKASKTLTSSRAGFIFSFAQVGSARSRNYAASGLTGNTGRPPGA
jgi:hypothetical protein